MKRLVINADDFGFTRDVNAGIIQAHRQGVLTSTTLMANGIAFENAVQLARETPSLDIGCHLVLVQGASVLTGRNFPRTLPGVVAALLSGKLDIYAELRAQIEKILTAGILPTHLDSHKHTHLMPKIFREVVRLAKEFEIAYVRLPLDHSGFLARMPGGLACRYYRRLGRRTNVHTLDHFTGFRLTGSLTERSFATALSSLPEGTTEFMCHPGFLGYELTHAPTRLKESRLQEFTALISPRIRELISELEIELVSFRDLIQVVG